MSEYYNNCIFSYYISDTPAFFSELPETHTFGKYFVYLDGRTPFDSASENNRECAVFGYAVDVINGESDNLAEKMLNFGSSIDEIITYEKRLGGKYLILYREGNECYALGDATCSIPIFYSVGLKNFVCTSNSEYIVKSYNLNYDNESLKIRRSSDISQAMPFDVTPYKEIKQLIPNHYLSFSQEKAIRVVISREKHKNITVEQATDIVLPMIENITRFYEKHFKLYCPITSGRDSRVVLAFLKSNSDKPVLSYTIKHKEFKENEQDLIIPKKIAKVFPMHYEQIKVEQPDVLLKKQIDEIVGANKYSQRTLTIANTLYKRYNDGAILNGDIIGQVGKCSLHRDIPRFFATPGYFRCKLHNYSKGAKKQLKYWLDEIKKSGEKVNTFDLFSIENRMGRWASQENLIYNTIGQIYLNIFNSKSIIYIWTAVKRSERKKSKLHIALIEKKDSILLTVPFKDENVFIKCAKANGVFYLISSYIKYYADRIKFYKRGC